MKLTKFRVQNFRSFIDSGWIECQSVTAIAGVNEAGKSNLLKALWKLKPAFKSDNKILRTDIPIDQFDSIMDSDLLPNFITAQFYLEDSDKELLKLKFKNYELNFDTVTISRSLSGEYSVNYPVTILDAIRPKLDQYIIKIMPGFIYYSNYGNLDSNIYLPQILSKFNKSGVNTISKSKKRTIKLLLMYIGITPEMLVVDTPILEQATKSQLKLTAEQLFELTTKQERYKKLFEKASQRLTREFNQWWHQGKYEFEFAFDNGNLTILVTDENGIKAPLESRSVGIQWFLSFFLVFSLESQLFYTNTIMLLDESGATLHGLAQQDLVAFFDELAQNNQIIYSTHSNFMLPAEKLDRTRLVYKDSKGHSVTTSDMSLKDNTKSGKTGLMPVATSVNLKLSENIMKSSFPLIVASKVDEIYLNLMKDCLLQAGVLTTQMANLPLVILNVDNQALEATIQILSGDKGLPCVYLENRQDTEQEVQKLTKGLYKSEPQKILTPQSLDKKTTLEDFIPYEFFANSCGNYLVNNLGDEFTVKVSKSFILQLEENDNFDKLPKDYRYQMAKIVSDYIMQNKKDIKHFKNILKSWEEVFVKIYKTIDR